MSDTEDAALGVAMIVVIVGFYFIPTWIAIARKHHNATLVFVLNVCLAWSVIGWIGVLIWAIAAHAAAPPPLLPGARDAKQCPYCAETIRQAAVVCRFCGRELST